MAFRGQGPLSEGDTEGKSSVEAGVLRKVSTQFISIYPALSRSQPDHLFRLVLTYTHTKTQ